MTIPDIGDTFAHGDHTYRVDGWLKPNPTPSAVSARHGPDRVPLVFCRRDEAVYVSGYGVCGRIVRVSDVVATGRVSWSEETIERERQSNQMLIGREVF